MSVNFLFIFTQINSCLFEKKNCTRNLQEVNVSMDWGETICMRFNGKNSSPVKSTVAGEAYGLQLELIPNLVDPNRDHEIFIEEISENTLFSY